MRYIRFLKTPRIVREKGSSKTLISCLITITSDLGDSFLPYDLTLAVELLHVSQGNEEENIVIWKTVQWIGGMRSLAITLPIGKSHRAWPLRVRIGVEPKSQSDELGSLLQNEEFRGVVSAWSGLMDPKNGLEVAERFVQRRFEVGANLPLYISEETGDSIARHLWDAGITLGCHISKIIRDCRNGGLLPLQDGNKRLQVVELGTGCGIVGLTLAKTVPASDVVLTDLQEASEIVRRNLEISRPSLQGSAQFKELDWESNLPEPLSTSETACPHCQQIDIVVAADCTYNADSSPVLVSTMQKIAQTSHHALIIVAMKRRHDSEEVFFDFMSRAQFKTATSHKFPLPGDENSGEEQVEVYMYQYEGQHHTKSLGSAQCISDLSRNI
ncbi:hypothetical protein DM02DRAFT_671346 [Periconia macrospinosa]|uniref:Uncharacterized protein n=1 Tax=Periconia macrospinosa TaxID=97972 RepID=A0A2V1DSV3_9PLEO|nr:hypothetical protein DM02DRAFT_671346 [Periconia macrospinosa]